MGPELRHVTRHRRGARSRTRRRASSRSPGDNGGATAPGRHRRHDHDRALPGAARHPRADVLPADRLRRVAQQPSSRRSQQYVDVLRGALRDVRPPREDRAGEGERRARRRDRGRAPTRSRSPPRSRRSRRGAARARPRSYADELAARGVMCIGDCLLAATDEYVEGRARTTSGSRSRRSSSSASTGASSSPASWSGARPSSPATPSSRTRSGSSAWSASTRASPGSTRPAPQFVKQLRGEGRAARRRTIPYELDLAKAQENARNMIAKLKDGEGHDRRSSPATR